MNSGKKVLLFKECNAKISAHNKDWHQGMCDDCFDQHLDTCDKEKR